MQIELNKNLPWRRLGAFVVDYALWRGLKIPIENILGFSKTMSVFVEPISSWYYLLIPLLYTILTLTILGGTIGMLIFKLQVVEVKTGRKPNILTAFLRHVIASLEWIPFLLGYLWVFFDSRMQSFADKMANTIVISRKDFGQEIPDPTAKDNKICKTGLVLFIICLIISASLVFAFSYKAPLDPEVEAILLDMTPEQDPITNSFYSLIAFAVPENKDPFEVGFRRVTEANQALFSREKLGFDDIGTDVGYKAERDSLNPIQNKLNLEEDEPYTELAYKNSEVIKRLFKEYDYLELRYNQIAEMKTYKTMIIPSIFSYGNYLFPLNQYNKLYCLNFTLEYMTGNRDKAIEMMKMCEKVTTNLLEKADTQMEKMVASLMITNYQSALEALLSYDENIDSRFYLYISEIKDYSPEAMSMRKALMYELNELMLMPIIGNTESVEFLKDYRIDTKDLEETSLPYFKPTPTFNSFYQTFDDIAGLSEISSFELNKEYTKFKRRAINPLGYLNNTIGTVLLKFDRSELRLKSVVRIRDLQIKNNMLMVGALIRGKHLLGIDTPAFLDENKDKFNNPYTREQFQWNMETGELSFDGPDQEERADYRKIQL